LSGKFSFLVFVSQCAQVAMFLFAHFYGFVISHFQPKCLFEKKMESFFQFLGPTNSHGRHKYSRFFWFPEEYSTRHSQLFREKCAWEALILFGGNKQLITLPITQKRMLCGYQVILSLELMSWEFSETSQKDFISLL
jgi:hypothetical protein